MAKKQQKTKKGKSTRKYDPTRTRRNKLKRVLQSSGTGAARNYATLNGLTGFLMNMGLYQRKMGFAANGR